MLKLNELNEEEIRKTLTCFASKMNIDDLKRSLSTIRMMKAGIPNRSPK